MSGCMHAPHSERLGELAMPVVVAAGQRGGPRGVGMAQDIARRCQNARFVLMDGVGHLVSIEAPDRLMHLLREVLSSSTSMPARG